ncbi:hydroxyethylthiazole kinase-like [Lactuca sativa]|uniref:hydroxyethylthiazole kinase-like n=1 Tax=Lactuca sativa TaxID=4236 RepID=UPI000CD9F25E|nr:hydroxyethylthiazole kinase-like [Lactuca sativa]
MLLAVAAATQTILGCSGHHQSPPSPPITSGCGFPLRAKDEGADSLHESSDAVESVKSSDNIVAILGSVDFVTDGQRVFGSHNGVPIMQKITASGCSVTTPIAAFVAIDPAHAFEATTSAFSVFGLTGDIGMELAKGSTSLRVHLIDSLHSLDQDIVLEEL